MAVGALTACWASAGVMAPVSTISAITSLARAAARSGWLIGLRADGALRTAARIAASAMVMSRADLPKNFCDAFSTPVAPAPK